jgi:hypothetical protein
MISMTQKTLAVFVPCAAAAWLSAAAAAEPVSNTAAYILDTSLISGQKLGSMGEPVDYVYGNRLIRFCCAGCVSSFEASPEKM